MNGQTATMNHEQLGQQFLDALDTGDLKMIMSLWKLTADNPMLARLFCELSEAAYEDLATAPGDQSPAPETSEDKSSPYLGTSSSPIDYSQSLDIGGEVVITVISIERDRVRLGITAPPHVTIHRSEVYEAIQAQLRREQHMTRH